MTDWKLTFLTITFLFVVPIRCDYKCMCNYNEEKSVFSSASENVQPVAFMYEFDCKPFIGQINGSGSDSWIVISSDHQKGYVLKDAQTQIQACPGDIPTVDSLPTSDPPKTAGVTVLQQSNSPAVPTTVMSATDSTRVSSTTTTLAASSTTPMWTTTTESTSTTSSSTTTVRSEVLTRSPTMVSTSTQSTAPTTTSTTQTMTSAKTAPTSVASSTHSGDVVCPSNVQQTAPRDNGILFVNTFDRSCYELVPHRRSWMHAESDCQSKGGHLASIKDFRDQDVVQNHVKSYNLPVWIGLNDRHTEGSFVWTSGEPLIYQRWKTGLPVNHMIDDCVTMNHQTGLWEDGDCLDLNYYICEFDAVYGTTSNMQSTTPVPVNLNTDGNTHMCPSSVQSAARRDRGVLGQYGGSCYELITHNKVSWQHGESMCKTRGGHLAHISSQMEQDFIQSFMTRHYPQHAVWIGLHDTNVEGHLEWTSGSAVSYTNWVPGHLGNHASMRTEDCVAFIPYKKGQWDDLPCGGSFLIFSDFGETHPLLCQYEIGSTHLVG